MRKLTRVYREGALIDYKVEEMTRLEKLAWYWRLLTGQTQPFSVVRSPK